MMFVHEPKYLGACRIVGVYFGRSFRSLRTSTLVNRLRVPDSQSADPWP